MPTVFFNRGEDNIAKLKRTLNIVHSPVTGWLILSISLALTVTAFLITQDQVEARARDQFFYRAKEITQAIHERVGVYEQALWGGAGLFSASTHVDRSEWHSYVNSLGLKTRLPGIQGMGYAVPVAATERASFEAAVRAEGFDDFSIHPQGERDDYTTILYLEPFDWRNQRAFGYDMWSNEIRREAMARARDEGSAATSGVITLVQETDSDVQNGFLTYVPVYRTRTVPTDLEQRRAQFQGWVYAAFRAGDLMTGILGTADTRINFRIYDGETIEASALLFNSNSGSKEGAAHSLAASHEEQIRLQGRPWLIHFSVSQDALLSAYEARQPYYVLAAGVVIDLLLFYVIISLSLVNRHAERTAKSMQQAFDEQKGTLTEQAKIIEEAEREAQLFFELAPEAFLIVARDGRIVKANKYAHQLFGFEEGNLVQRNVDALVPENVRYYHQKLRKDFVGEDKSRPMGRLGTLNAIKSDGSEFPVAINLLNFNYRGQAHTVAAIHDVSRQKQFEQTLDEARQKAEAASQSKSEFVANMSHEIRTPLNAVLGAAQLLEKTQTDPLQRKYIKMIRGSGEALLGIINDILDFSKIEAGKMVLHAEAYDLDGVLARVGAMMHILAEEKNLQLCIDVSPEVPRLVVGDALRLQQVLVNLISNAIKFTENGEVFMTVSVKGSAGDGKQTVVFSVTDTGIGMTPTQRENLFHAFTQADTSITRRFGGTGLGLVITNRIVQLMGGHLDVDSQWQQGSTFRVRVPLALQGAKKPPPHFELQKQTVLAILPEARQRQALDHLLSAWQLPHVNLASLSQIAPELTHNNAAQAPGLLIVDEHALSEDHKVLSELLAHPDFAKTVTLVATQRESAMALAATTAPSLAQGIVAKPLCADTLAEALRSALDQGRGGERASTELNRHFIGKSLLGKRMLLVEDNLLNQTIARDMLEDAGATIVIAQHGAEAIDRYRSDPNFDIVLMDIQMPVMDGLTATRILREELQCPLPIVAMTAGVLESERQRYLAEGLNDCIAKPLDLAEALSVIHRHINIAKARTAATPQPSGSPSAVFNAGRLESLARGKVTRLRQLAGTLHSVLEQGFPPLNLAREALRKGDRESALFELHGFKGMIANVGGDQLAATLLQMEQAIKNEALPEALDDDFDVLESQFAAFANAAAQWRDQILARDEAP